LREMVDEKKIPMLLYEAGTALRFEHRAALIGVEGILNVMRSIGMLPPLKLKPTTITPYIARSSQWVRAPISGIFVTRKKLGERVSKGDKLGFITNPFGDYEYAILAPVDGVIIGNSILPLANEGDGIYHIATFSANHHMRDEELYPYIDPDLM